jgi:hypothetical protein
MIGRVAEATMADDDRPKTGHTATIGQLVMLKAALGESIRWRGLNAKQVEALQDVPDWPAVHRSYAKWRHKDLGYGRLPWGWLAVALLGVLGWYLGAGSLASWGKSAAYIGGLMTLVEMSRRAGHQEGYVDGYSAGHEAGCNRALGLSDEDARTVGEMAREMDLDALQVRAVTGEPEPDSD